MNLNGKLEHLLRNEPDIAFRNRIYYIVKELNVKPKDKILECGCGRGFILNILSELYRAKMSGIDINKEHLKIARKQLPKKVVLKHASVYEIPFKDKSFNKIILSEVLEHLEDEDKALQEIRRVLKPGGKIVITVPNKDYPFLWDPINRFLEDIFQMRIQKGIFAGIWAYHVRLYDRNQLRKLLQKNRFRVKKITGATHYCFPFNHNIVYGIGKTLREAKLLPKTIVNTTDRFSYSENKGSTLNPINWILALFNRINKLNQGKDFDKSVCLHATAVNS
jgi:ubiquinone/menaquinone biosynthesis C-methylase UbiE